MRKHKILRVLAVCLSIAVVTLVIHTCAGLRATLRNSVETREGKGKTGRQMIASVESNETNLSSSNTQYDANAERQAQKELRNDYAAGRGTDHGPGTALRDGDRADGLEERRTDEADRSINETDPGWVSKVDCCYTYGGGKPEVVPKALWEGRGCEKRIPRAMIVGVKKCGTGTLSRYLSLHPAIAMSKTTGFEGSNITSSIIQNWVNQMPLSSPQQLTMTKSPVFIFKNMVNAFTNLKPYLAQNTKFIAILRDPVQRAMSDYTHQRNMSGADAISGPFVLQYKKTFLRETFEKTIRNHKHDRFKDIKMITLGQYIDGLGAALKVYTKDQFLLLDGNVFAKDPYPTMVQIEEFLELPKFYKRSHFQLNEEKGFYCAHVPERPDFQCMPSTKGRHHLEVPEDVVRRLRDHYRPFNLALAQEMGVNFTWMNN